MSGGGGNFGSGSFRPSTDQEITCENLNIAISIIRPDFSVFDTQELNGILLTMYAEDGALVFEYKDNLVGYGADALISKLIECLEQGYNYTAVISSFEWDSFIRVKVQ
jgi:hypothetical protein